tara:strand:+ start:817 stop:1110 length:294 start_codon:yes stop_codon:yes gene_type:complete
MNNTTIIFIVSIVFLILAIIFTSIHKKCDTDDDDCEKKQKTYKKCFTAFWILFAIFFVLAAYRKYSPPSGEIVYDTPEGPKSGDQLNREAAAMREGQ